MPRLSWCLAPLGGYRLLFRPRRRLERLVGLGLLVAAQVLAIDAKERRVLDAATVASEGSKYLWGLRRAATPDTPALQGVVLVAPESGDEGTGPRNLSRVGCVAAAPFARVSEATDRLDANTVRSWLAELGLPL